MSDAMDLLRSVKDRSTDTEFYTPIPDGYQLGRTRYVAVFGTVMSGLGKGIFSSSLAKLLKDKGFRVSPIKLEGYLNVDSGTLNPFRHGEVFVLDDGMETDMDLGTYERMLDQDLTQASFATAGQIYSSVLAKERAGGYLGRDVQMIPHVTGEVKLRLRELAADTRADVVFVEVGGTVGDFENSFYIEALRELAYEEGEGSVAYVALTYVLSPPSLGEQKSKAAQLGIKRLMELGIMPHVIACRAQSEVTKTVRQKISVYTNVPVRRVFSMHDLPSIYLLPGMMREAGLDSEVVQLLNLGGRVNSAMDTRAAAEWQKFTSRIGKASRSVTIGVTGKYTALRDSYASIIKALEHAGVANDAKVNVKWIDTTEIEEAAAGGALADVGGIIVPGGFGVRGTAGKIACIRYARENRLPYLGICLGFQMAAVEFARNICGIAGADSTEINPDCAEPVIDILPEQKKIEGLGGNMRLGGQDVQIIPGTLAAGLFSGAERVRMRFRHRYEVDPRYVERLEAGGLVFSGRHPSQPIMQILELPEAVHPYFIGTQAHPCLTSRPLRPQPMFVGLVAAALRRGR
ncbi:MAG TPA: CTP synthase [Phycisphaerae bacterium]|nr:CTP synthase [Phycisphaerae bacterium]